MAFDAARVERIRRGRADQPDDRAARYLIDEIEKACLRDPDGDSLGPRYDALMTALDAICDRLEIRWSPTYPSLRAWGRATDLSGTLSWQERHLARKQFEALLDALDDEVSLLEVVDEPEGWDAVTAEIDELRDDFANADSPTDYGNLARQCREIFVSLADLAYDRSEHGPVEEGEDESKVKPRLRAVIRSEASGTTHDEMRAMALKTVDLANKLQHRKATAKWEVGNLCDATILTTRILQRLVEKEH